MSHVAINVTYPMSSSVHTILLSVFISPFSILNQLLCSKSAVLNYKLNYFGQSFNKLNYHKGNLIPGGRWEFFSSPPRAERLWGSVPEARSLRVKQPGREAGHSLPPSAEVKECVEL